MRYESEISKIVHVLMWSRFYFSFSLRERYDLIRHILGKLQPLA